MVKVITMRVSEEDYRKIVAGAKIERRPLSNFITTIVLKGLEESDYVDAIEMAQIRSDKRLLAKLSAGHDDVKRHRGRLVG
jgi:uncharacterized protein (DUF1778 family)